MLRSSKRIAHNHTKKVLSHILKNMRTSPAKTPQQLERHLKGVASHRRISILILVSKNEGITLDQIATRLECNIKTTAEHTRRLVLAGLVNKKYMGRNVGHSLSPYGKIFYNFLRTF